jgi:hypothetical protein
LTSPPQLDPDGGLSFYTFPLTSESVCPYPNTMGGIKNINLLAFICCIKARRSDSCLGKNDKSYKVAREIGISSVSFNKYLKRLKDIGLFNPVNNSIVKFTKCLEVLFPDVEFVKRAERKKGMQIYYKIVYYIKIFKYRNKNVCFKTFKERIEYALVEANYRQQEFITGKFNVLNAVRGNCLKTGDKKKLDKLKKFHGVDNIKDLECISLKAGIIKTGKNHLSSILGCSASTGSNRLRKWAKEGRFKRKIISEIIDGIPVSPIGLETVKQQYGNNVVIVKGKYVRYIGSVITFPFSLEKSNAIF